jgi:hypothetical protein
VPFTAVPFTVVRLGAAPLDGPAFVCVPFAAPRLAVTRVAAGRLAGSAAGRIGAPPFAVVGLGGVAAGAFAAVGRAPLEPARVAFAGGSTAGPFAADVFVAGTCAGNVFAARPRGDGTSGEARRAPAPFADARLVGAASRDTTFVDGTRAGAAVTPALLPAARVGVAALLGPPLSAAAFAGAAPLAGPTAGLDCPARADFEPDEVVVTAAAALEAADRFDGSAAGATVASGFTRVALAGTAGAPAAAARRVDRGLSAAGVTRIGSTASRVEAARFFEISLLATRSPSISLAGFAITFGPEN